MVKPTKPGRPGGGACGIPGGTPDFKCQGSSNGGKNQNPKNSLGLPTKPKKIPGKKLTPKKTHAKFPSLKHFQEGF